VLEPDGRTPASQPPAVGMALRTLDEADAWDEELVEGVCKWLAADAPDEGGASFVEPTVEYEQLWTGADANRAPPGARSTDTLLSFLTYKRQ
jgi:hypothetical protein